MAIESDETVKVVKNDPIIHVFDSKLNQSNRTSTISYSIDSTEYCGHAYYQNSYRGCNVWGSNKTTRDSNGNFVETMSFDVGGKWTNALTANKQYTLPNYEATLNTYLNTEYYNNFDAKIKKLVVDAIFDVGVLGFNNSSLIEDINQEKANTWRGKVGLINPTDYVKASINNNCSTIEKYAHSSWGGSESCYNDSLSNNWLKFTEDNTVRTINPAAYGTESSCVTTIKADGSILCNRADVTGNSNVNPTMFLNKSIILCGDGTSINPYKIQ